MAAGLAHYSSAETVEAAAAADLVSEAKSSIRKASSDLMALADWCEESFVPTSPGSAAPKATAEGGGFRGSDSLVSTFELAVTALHAVAGSVGVLAEDLELRLSRLDADVRRAASEVRWLSMAVDQVTERRGRREIRALATVASKPETLPAVYVNERWMAPLAGVSFERQPIDYTVLDGIGVGGTIAAAKDNDEGKMSSSASTSAGTPPNQPRVASLRRGAAAGASKGTAIGVGGGSTLLRRGMKMPTLPTAPKYYLTVNQKGAADTYVENVAGEGIPPPAAIDVPKGTENKGADVGDGSETSREITDDFSEVFDQMDQITKDLAMEFKE